MKVILLKEVKNLGRKGDVREVSDGYAQNCLLPQKLAEIATKHAATMAETQKRKKERSRQESEKEKRRLAKKINGQSYMIKSKADESGTLYAGIDAAAIAKELNRAGAKVSAGEILLSSPMKKAGDYSVALNLAEEKVFIKIIVTRI